MQKMKQSNSLLAALLLLCVLLPHVQGIRFGKGLPTLLGHHHKIYVSTRVEVDPIREDNRREASVRPEEVGLVSMMKKTASGPSRKSSKDWLPSIQEDYYGPRNHRPRHHKLANSLRT